MERGDAVALARALIREDSRNPALAPGAPGEAGVARLLAGILAEWGFGVEVIDAAPNRPNVIARTGRRGSGTAPTLMFNGHMDVVATDGMTHSPFGAEERAGRLYGRGSADMKGGVAAMCAAAARAATLLGGEGGGGAGGGTGSAHGWEIVVAAVADEENESIGTRALIASGVRADAAIVTEPTRLAIAPAHRGFAWLDVELTGRAAHGSRYDIGVDAITHAGLLLAELDRAQREVLVARTHPLLGHASMHASLISGGIGMSTYPDHCSLRLERRTLPGESAEDVLREVMAACERVRSTTPSFRARTRLDFAQGPSDVAVDAPVVRSLGAALAASGEPVRVEGLSAWTDAALLNDAGIPAICFGPGDITLAHSAEEWVEIDEIERATVVLAELACNWLGERGGDTPWHS